MLCVAAPVLFSLIKLMAFVHSWYRTGANKGLGRTPGTFNSCVDENHLYPPPAVCLSISISRSHLGMGRAAGDGEKGKTGLLSWLPPELHTQHVQKGVAHRHFHWRHMDPLLPMKNEEKWGLWAPRPRQMRLPLLRRSGLVPSPLGAGRVRRKKQDFQSQLFS